MGSPTLHTLQDPILLLPWLCLEFEVAALQTLLPFQDAPGRLSKRPLELGIIQDPFFLVHTRRGYKSRAGGKLSVVPDAPKPAPDP
jgi:hypothetical protein